MTTQNHILSATPQATQFQECAKGAQCVHPNGALLPLSEFYTYKRLGRHDRTCKQCRMADNRLRGKPTSKQNKTSGEPGEDAVVARLREHGIYATIGRLSEFERVDVLAWGCCRCEVKSSLPMRPGFWQFNFSNQYKDGIKGDLVILVPMDENGNPTMFSVFPSDFPAFYVNGRLKSGVQLLTGAHHRKPKHRVLTLQDMLDHQDNWQLVENIRLGVSIELAQGTYDPKRVNKPDNRGRLF